MIGWLIGLAGLAVVAASLASFAPHWRLELFGHFRPHLAAAALVLAVLALAPGIPQGGALALALLAAAALNAYQVGAALPRAAPTGAGEGQSLRIAFSNLYLRNKQYQRAVEWVWAERPDLFIACEAHDRWPRELAALSDLYPFATRQPFGDIVVFSRWPSVQTDHVLKGWNGNAVVLEVESDRGRLTVVAIHTRVPWQENPGRGGYNLIADLAALLAKRAGDVIVLGDFNATPWSRPMRRLIGRSGLAFGPASWRGSFPAWLPSWMGLPIDLVLTRGGWTIVSRRIGPRIGSDHWPVVFEVMRQNRRQIPSP